jgi:hypothetical protein
MNVLEVNVSDQEVESLNDDLRMEWPDEGMSCPVLGCPNAAHHFRNLNNYVSHFNRFHRKKIMLYNCPLCKAKDTKRTEIVRHFRKAHKNKHMGPILSNAVKNAKYVDPGSFRIPKKRIHRDERENAKQQRMNSLPSQPLFELSDDYNARDHRFPYGGYSHE